MVEITLKVEVEDEAAIQEFVKEQYELEPRTVTECVAIITETILNSELQFDKIPVAIVSAR